MLNVDDQLEDMNEKSELVDVVEMLMERNFPTGFDKWCWCNSARERDSLTRVIT